MTRHWSCSSAAAQTLRNETGPSLRSAEHTRCHPEHSEGSMLRPIDPSVRPPHAFPAFSSLLATRPQRNQPDRKLTISERSESRRTIGQGLRGRCEVLRGSAEVTPRDSGRPERGPVQHRKVDTFAPSDLRSLRANSQTAAVDLSRRTTLRLRRRGVVSTVAGVLPMALRRSRDDLVQRSGHPCLRFTCLSFLAASGRDVPNTDDRPR